MMSDIMGKAWDGKEWKIVGKTCKHQYLFIDIFKCSKTQGYCNVLVKKCNETGKKDGLLKWASP